MSWGSGEYAHMVLTHQQQEVTLPPATLWLLRFHNFRSLVGPTPAYQHLLDDFDRSMLPWLQRFQVRHVLKAKKETADATTRLIEFRINAHQRVFMCHAQLLIVANSFVGLKDFI